MDALLIIDATRDQFPSSPPQPLIDLVDRARGVGGVIVHVAPEALGEDPADAGVDERPGSLQLRSSDEDDDAPEEPQLRIDSAVGTRDDELVLVSDVPDVFEGIDDLAEGLDDLGVDRIIVAGSNARDALTQSSYATLAIGFELIVVADGLADGSAGGPSGGHAWVTDVEAAGAVVKNGADVWLKM